MSSGFNKEYTAAAVRTAVIKSGVIWMTEQFGRDRITRFRMKKGVSEYQRGLIERLSRP